MCISVFLEWTITIARDSKVPTLHYMHFNSHLVGYLWLTRPDLGVNLCLSWCLSVSASVRAPSSLPLLPFYNFCLSVPSSASLNAVTWLLYMATGLATVPATTCYVRESITAAKCALCLRRLQPSIFNLPLGRCLTDCLFKGLEHESQYRTLDNLASYTRW